MTEIIKKAFLQVKYSYVIFMLIAVIIILGCEPKHRVMELGTFPVSNISFTSCLAKGSFLDYGEGLILEYGFCYSSTSQYPTTNDYTQRVHGDINQTTFFADLSGLSANTTYYYRAYARNNSGTTYGDQKSFRTLDGIVLNDYDGNQYWTLQIGEQRWMAEDLKVTHYSDGTALTEAIQSSEWEALAGNVSSRVFSRLFVNFGALYTWPAAMNGIAGSDSNPSGVQGVCPDGWHMPSDAEWKELEMFLGMSEYRADADNEWRGTDQGSQLAGTDSLWNDGYLEENVAFGSSAFNALPGGFRGSDGGISNFKQSGYWWSSSVDNYGNPYDRRLSYNRSDVLRMSNSVRSGHSVRCVKD